jgi:hypothetical protein
LICGDGGNPLLEAVRIVAVGRVGGLCPQIIQRTRREVPGLFLRARRVARSNYDLPCPSCKQAAPRIQINLLNPRNLRIKIPTASTLIFCDIRVICGLPSFPP